jgi:hypothetical protein
MVQVAGLARRRRGSDVPVAGQGHRGAPFEPRIARTRLALWVLVAASAVALAGEGPMAADEVSADRALPDRVAGPRPLRANPPVSGEARDPTEPFRGYPGAQPYSVVPRDGALNFYPCEDCHAVIPVNETRRVLYSPHPGVLDHGAGRVWCLDCHAGENRNALQTLAGEEVDFNSAYLVCGQCHYQPQKDWFFGAHGKRVGTWQGDRELYNCTHCHDPHAPAVRPRAPEGPPPVRKGLEARPAHATEPVEEGPHE